MPTSSNDLDQLITWINKQNGGIEVIFNRRRKTLSAVEEPNIMIS